MRKMMPTRRQIVAGLGSAPIVSLIWPGLGLAATDSTLESRLVVVVLRGGMDGLAAVAPYDDPSYRKQRGSLALNPPGQPDGVLDIGGGFGLHPNLKTLHASHQQGEFRAIHAVATPYRDRSHFSAQDVLENGTAQDLATDNGWLNRALPRMTRAKPENGIALGQTIPLILRGPASVTSWAPSILPAVNSDTLERIAMLYENDPLFGPALQNAINANDIADNSMSADEESRAAGKPGPRGRFISTMQAAGRFLSTEAGPRVAVTELTGWDTHAGQGASSGRLARQFDILDDGIAALKRELAPVWTNTIVLAVSEFGRTVAENGTGGTDHGTAGVAMMMGGAVKGGDVVTKWPGLKSANLHEGRDLMPTTDIRSVAKGILHDHMGVSHAALDNDVFPESGDAAALRDLVRG